MGVITAIFARRMVQAAGDEIDARQMLRSVGLDPDTPLDVTEMLSADAYYDLLERIVTQMRHGYELPLRIAPLWSLNDYGALGLAWKSAPTTRDSLERVVRFCRVWTDNLTYELRPEEGGSLYLLHRRGERRLGMRISNEAAVSSAASLIRQTTTPRFRPRAVYFRHKAPRFTKTHEAYFGCPVRFGSELDGLSIADEALDRPNHLADDGILSYLESQLAKEVKQLEARQDPTEDMVRKAISRSLSDGLPRMATIAKQLAMSERTLQRRLSANDLSFKQILESTQADLARNLLTQTDYPLSEVAFLTGFSEQSAFNRAFRRWADSTPSAYRKQA